jgi:hypothetical protein
MDKSFHETVQKLKVNANTEYELKRVLCEVSSNLAARRLDIAEDRADGLGCDVNVPEKDRKYAEMLVKLDLLRHEGSSHLYNITQQGQVYDFDLTLADSRRNRTPYNS